MRSYKDTPDKGEMVVVNIEDINPHSVYVSLEEYPEKNGLIHISEVARSWVRDIRKHVSEGEKTVAQVIEPEDDSGSIGLSLKRVNDKKKSDKMKEWNKERKAEKFLKKVADRVEEDYEKVYEEVSFPLQKEFGNTFDGFEESLVDEEAIKDAIPEKYVGAVKEVAKDNISLKKVKLEGDLEITVPSGDGLSKIKEALIVGEGVEVSYISAPKYKIQVWGRNQKQAKKLMKSTVQDIEEKIDKADGSFSFQRA